MAEHGRSVANREGAAPATSRRGALAILCLGLVALLLAYAASLLLREPCLGVADNLDFHRVTRPAGIEPLHVPRRPGRYVQCEYALGETDFATYASSAALAAWAARYVPIGAPPERMDLRQMGVLWLGVFTAIVAAVLLRRTRWPATLAVVAVVAVVVDPGYLLFWNSFYADGALLVALAGATLWLGTWGREPQRLSGQTTARWLGWTGLFWLLAFLGGGSKMQHVPFPAVLLIAVLPLVPGAGRRGRKVATIAGLLAIAGACAWHFFLGTGPRFPVANNYHAVYGGLAQVSSQPEAALAELGVPPELHGLPRRDMFSGRLPPDHPVHGYLANLSRVRLALLYADDPAAVGGALSRVHHEMALARTHTRGNLARDPDRPRKVAYDPPWRFGRLRAALLASWPPLLWVILGATLVACAAAWLRGGRARSRSAPYVLLAGYFLVQVLVVILGDGFVAFEQHLLGARFAFDLLLALVLVDLVTGVARAVRRRARSPGLTPAGRPAP